MREYFKILTSMKMMSILILIFAFSIALATLIENDFKIESAKALIYNAKWFELLMLLLAINLVVNIFRFKLYKLEKISIGLFHFAFIVILVGAFTTRYFGFEGVLHLREGESSDTIESLENYFQIKIKNLSTNKSYFFEKELLLGELAGNHLNEKLKIDDTKLHFVLNDYIPNATKTIVESEKGDTMIELKASHDGIAENIVLKKGEFANLGDVNFCFEAIECPKPSIDLNIKDSLIHIISPEEFETLSMDTQESGKLVALEESELKKRLLYSNSHLQFVFLNFYKSAKIDYKSSIQSQENLLRVSVKVGETIKEIDVLSRAVEFTIDNFEVSMKYGPKKIKLPFSLKLNDFELLRYPGSMSPSSYSSYMNVNGEFDYKIYMNHILDYKGYRFYQSSYDRDELGTILSVNSDYLGTKITYLGYILLAIGMFISLFNSRSRFKALAKKIEAIREEKLKLLLLIVFLFVPMFESKAVDTLDTINAFEKSHADDFGSLLVQDSGGRIKPLDTLSRDILHKIYGKEKFYGLNANQVFLGMTIKPQDWQTIKIVKVKSRAINDILGVGIDEKYLAFVDFFTKDGEYKLKKYVEEANQKRPINRTQFDKDVIKIDERINVSYMVYIGSLLRIYPKPSDSDNTWFSPIEAMEVFGENDGKIIKDLTFNYFSEIDKALESGNWERANEKLLEIKKYQEFYGKSLFPASGKIYAELLYNKLNLFNVLIYLYLLVGIVLLVVSFIKIINPKITLLQLNRYSGLLIYLFFGIHTFALILRWYISGHAPWSDGFESMVYIAWTIILAGILLSKQDSMTLSATTILSALTLFVANLSWMDPQISNLVPVLKSYWLTIHVSMISGSYGFLALGAILGFVNLILFIFRKKENQFLDLSIKELSYVAEKSLIIGVIFLTIGNFLGGVWANESWGRYWGWDPKETWTLVTMLIYAFVLHMRFIPQLNSIYTFNLASLLAFSSVIMTYFGVNFYLSGLHSYAKGDPVPIPSFVYYSVITIAFIATLAYYKRELK